MADIPDGSWSVTISGAINDDWAEGTLVVATNQNNVRSMTYAGQSTTNNNYDVNDVCWSVTLQAPNPTPPPATKDCNVNFTGGKYTQSTNTFALGAVNTCLDEITGDPEDEWSATPN